jgi:hypothetical protein
MVFVLFGGSVQQRMGSKTLAAAASRASGQQQVQMLTETNVTLADYWPLEVLSSRPGRRMTRTDASSA